jgi:hypothetical protein
MAGASTSIDELRRLQSALSDFCSHMDIGVGTVQNAADNLDWNDARYREFMSYMSAWIDDFKGLVRQIRQFEPALARHVQLLEAY